MAGLSESEPSEAELLRELSRANITFIRKLGAGNFGEVSKAMLDDRNEKGIPPFAVAVKALRDDSGEARMVIHREWITFVRARRLARGE